MSNHSTATNFNQYRGKHLSLKSPVPYFGIIALIIVISFFEPFWWMRKAWFLVESYSPGPMTPVLLGMILYFKLKSINKSFRISPKKLKLYGPILGILVLVGYFGAEHPKYIPLDPVLVPVAYGILFFGLTAALFYIAFVISAAPGTADTPAAKKLCGVAGGFIIVTALALHFLTMRGDLPRMSIMAYIGLMIGLIMNIFGWKTTKQMLFPLLFLLFMVPWGFIDDYIGGPLRAFATPVAVAIMKVIGLPVERTGTQFSVGDMAFSVEAACSGLKSLMALSALGATFAFITQPTLFRKFFVALCALPIAMTANILRLVGVGVTAQFFGQEIAMKIFHDNAAMFLYIVAILLLFSVDKLFKVKWLKIENW